MENGRCFSGYHDFPGFPYSFLNIHKRTPIKQFYRCGECLGYDCIMVRKHESQGLERVTCTTCKRTKDFPLIYDRPQNHGIQCMQMF